MEKNCLRQFEAPIQVEATFLVDGHFSIKNKIWQAPQGYQFKDNFLIQCNSPFLNIVANDRPLDLIGI